MSMTTERETRRSEGEDQVLIQDLGRRLGCLWECDRNIAGTEGRPELQEYWRSARSQELESIDQLKSLITQQIQNNGI